MVLHYNAKFIMSWVQDEWKEGLNQKVLLKISDIENQNEKLKKDSKQKQFQLESLEAAFSKQVNVKVSMQNVFLRTS